MQSQVALREMSNEARPNARRLVNPIVYFIILCSVVVHGITLPTVKHTPRGWYHISKHIFHPESRLRGSKDPISRPLGSGALFHLMSSLSSS